MTRSRRNSMTCHLVVLIGAMAIPALGQSYTPRFVPQSSNGQTYVCLDQYNRPIPYAGWSLSLGVYFYTNAHYHGPESSQPVSALSTTSGYSDSWGYFTFLISTKLVGQAEFVDWACTLGGRTTYGRFDHAVGYYLDYVDVPSIWKRIGGDETGGGTGHGSTYFNRYMNAAAATKLYNASVAYKNAHPEVTYLCTNDMALYLGGKFDIGTATRWSSPHSWHDFGTHADVAGAGSAQCTNQGGTGVNVAEFIDRCVDQGATYSWSVIHDDHAHCGFTDPAKFPH